MVDYGKQKAIKDYGKYHREGITGMLERQYFADISPANNKNLNKYRKGDYPNLKGKRIINLNSNGTMRCNHQRSSGGVC